MWKLWGREREASKFRKRLVIDMGANPGGGGGPGNWLQLKGLLHKSFIMFIIEKLSVSIGYGKASAFPQSYRSPSHWLQAP